MKKNEILVLASVAIASVVLPHLGVAAEVDFSGYARYGAHYQAGDKQYVEVGTTGRSLGRLGNEVNGGEFQLSTTFEGGNGAQWDLVVLFDNWAHEDWSSPGGVDLKKAYAGVKNIIPSQPQMYFWAGRDFHGRATQSLNDYYYLTHDGQGGGFKDLDLGAGLFDLGFVGNVKNGDGGSLGSDEGSYALTTKFHGVETFVGTMDFYANYGFTSEAGDPSLRDRKPWQVAATLDIGGNHKAIVRYSEDSDNTVLIQPWDFSSEEDDLQIIFASLEGTFNKGNPLSVQYLISYKEFAGMEGTEPRDKNEYAAIVRPMYSWNDIHSTWFEAGYAVEDFENGNEKKGWKTTISQNISLGGLSWSRPMLRFYVTMGEVDDFDSTKYDTLSYGAMFEAWW
ncbi:carbohydrate porin [Vibrio hippocampi]|uniref:Maltoporin n=1 Tax=Vibrio hippocampi TaxID=654686 RepID=A0ABN8DIJ0_9VIBR|nr:carbohydrate porin [Vibrio hippocampi]CAH0528838.1 Maltoporin [Vibrio hippocampi]